MLAFAIHSPHNVGHENPKSCRRYTFARGFVLGCVSLRPDSQERAALHPRHALHEVGLP